MRSHRLQSVLGAVAGVGGVLVFMAVSGLYTVKPVVIDGDVIYFGFPFAWFEAGRKGLFVIGPWVYHFVWQNFVADFVVYDCQQADSSTCTSQCAGVSEETT